MDKPKLQPGPKPRVKRALPPPGDFIALGKSSSSKPRPNNESDIKPSQPIVRKPVIGAPSHIAVGQKRKESSPVNPVSAKQTRTFSPSFNRSKEKTLDVTQTLPSVKFVDAPPAELEEMVLAAVAKGDVEHIEGLLCGAIKALKTNRLKPDPMLYLTMMSLAKSQQRLFSSKRVTEHLLQFLRRENSLTAVKPKPNTLLGIMTCNILLHAYQNEDVWPQSFMKVYVEDALSDRAWVDNEHNKDFVNNVTKVFDTVLPQKIASNNTSATKVTIVEPATSTMQVDGCAPAKAEEEKIMEEVGISLEAEDPPLVKNRYAMHKDEIAVQTYVHEIVKEQLNKRQMIDSVSRNTLRFLTAVCGYVEVRLLASQKIETWLQNPKLTRPTQELLISVVLNCNTHSPDDIEVIGNLVKMRLKAKPVANHYINCMKELLNQHPDNLGTTMKRVIYNELNQQRNPNNMAILQAMFASNPESSAKHLASVFQDLLCNRDDFLRAIRALFREIVRSLKYEINLVEFCRSLMQERKEAAFLELEQPFKDRMFASVIDLINLGCFLCVSPAVKELATALAKGEKRDYSVLQAFQMQVSTIQRDAIWFFHTKVKLMYNCNEKDFIAGLNHILFLEAAEMYSQKDNWPPEAERNNLLQLVAEVPLTEDGLLRLHLLGLSDDTPMNSANTLDVVEKMVQRSAVLSSGLNGIEIERTEVMTMLLSLSAYSHPKEIALPTGYAPPTLTIKNLYWKSWLILLMLAATNPSTIGIKVWEMYPTARCMMEMLITRMRGSLHKLYRRVKSIGQWLMNNE